MKLEFIERFSKNTQISSTFVQWDPSCSMRKDV